MAYVMGSNRVFRNIANNNHQLICIQSVTPRFVGNKNVYCINYRKLYRNQCKRYVDTLFYSLYVTNLHEWGGGGVVIVKIVLILKTYRSANSSGDRESKNISSLPKTTAFKSNEEVFIV